jgi:hypothetical protein
MVKPKHLMKIAVLQQLASLIAESEKDFPGKSFEFLIEITAQRARMRGIWSECDASDIVEALRYQDETSSSNPRHAP